MALGRVLATLIVLAPVLAGCIEPIDNSLNAAVAAIDAAHPDLHTTALRVEMPEGSDALAIRMHIAKDDWKPDGTVQGIPAHRVFLKCDIHGASEGSTISLQGYGIDGEDLHWRWSGWSSGGDWAMFGTGMRVPTPVDRDLLILLGINGDATHAVLRCGAVNDWMDDLPKANKTLLPDATGTGTQHSLFWEWNGRTLVSEGVIVDDTRTTAGSVSANGALVAIASHTLDTPGVNLAAAGMWAGTGHARGFFGYNHDGYRGDSYEGEMTETPVLLIGGFMGGFALDSVNDYAITGAGFAPTVAVESLLLFSSQTIPIDVETLGYTVLREAREYRIGSAMSLNGVPVFTSDEADGRLYATGPEGSRAVMSVAPDA